MIGKLALQGFGFAYGFMNLTLMFAIASIRDRAFANKTSTEELERGTSTCPLDMAFIQR